MGAKYDQHCGYGDEAEQGGDEYDACYETFVCSEFGSHYASHGGAWHAGLNYGDRLHQS